MVKIVDRIKNSEQILIKRIAAETARLVSQENARLINLSQGTPNLKIFDKAYDAMVELLQGKKLPYTDVPGIAKVRETAAQFVNQYYRMEDKFNASNIIITAGAVQAVYNVLALSVENKDDVVVSPLPAYGLYKHQTELLGGTFQTIPTRAENNFVPTIDDLRAVFEQNTVTNEAGVRSLKIKSIALCYPNNPAGAALTKEQCKQFADFLDEMLQTYPDPGFSIILDEVYLGISSTPVKEYQSILMYASKRVLESCFLILSASKGLGAMPGARAAFCCCPTTRYIDNMIKVQQACSANASIISQEGLRASLLYLIENPSVVDEFVSAHYVKRTAYVAEQLNTIGQKYLNGSTIVARKPEATFYIFADFSGLTTVKTDLEIQQFFRDMYKNGQKKIGVAVVPGVAFGMDPRQKLIRFSCAVEMEDLEMAMQVIDEAVHKMTSSAR